MFKAFTEDPAQRKIFLFSHFFISSTRNQVPARGIGTPNWLYLGLMARPSARGAINLEEDDDDVDVEDAPTALVPVEVDSPSKRAKKAAPLSLPSTIVDQAQLVDLIQSTIHSSVHESVQSSILPMQKAVKALADEQALDRVEQALGVFQDMESQHSRRLDSFQDAESRLQSQGCSIPVLSRFSCLGFCAPDV